MKRSDLEKVPRALDSRWWMQTLCCPIGEEGPQASLCPSWGSLVCFLYSFKGGWAPPLSCGRALNLSLSVAYFLPQCGADNDPLTLGQGRPGWCRLWASGAWVVSLLSVQGNSVEDKATASAESFYSHLVSGHKYLLSCTESFHS